MSLKPACFNSQQNIIIAGFYLRAPRPSARFRAFYKEWEEIFWEIGRLWVFIIIIIILRISLIKTCALRIFNFLQA